MKLGVAPTISKRVMTQIIKDLKQSFDKRDSSKAGEALRCYFQELNLSMQEALAGSGQQKEQAVG